MTQNRPFSLVGVHIADVTKVCIVAEFVLNVGKFSILLVPPVCETQLAFGQGSTSERYYILPGGPPL